jgi:3-deoxy-manno-octulosonate cytidylyltransferase (CMP-KDO synthetase)
MTQDDAGRLIAVKPISFPDTEPPYFRHIGIYGYRAKFVVSFSEMGDSLLERTESLEQLRVLEHGYNIHIEVATGAPPHGVDTPEDLIKLNGIVS